MLTGMPHLFLTFHLTKLEKTLVLFSIIANNATDGTIRSNVPHHDHGKPRWHPFAKEWLLGMFRINLKGNVLPLIRIAEHRCCKAGIKIDEHMKKMLLLFLLLLCVRACVCACVRACVCVGVWVRLCVCK